jgi:formylglycine-generating enzyme required for sulfatase activity
VAPTRIGSTPEPPPREKSTRIARPDTPTPPQPLTPQPARVRSTTPSIPDDPFAEAARRRAEEAQRQLAAAHEQAEDARREAEEARRQREAEIARRQEAEADLERLRTSAKFAPVAQPSPAPEPPHPPQSPRKPQPPMRPRRAPRRRALGLVVAVAGIGIVLVVLVAVIAVVVVPRLLGGGSNPAGIDWVSVEGGSYRIGSTDGDPDELNGPRVTLSRFDIARTEVTVAQYRRCVDAGVCSPPGEGNSNCNWNHADRDDHPINCVLWDDARTFASWAGGRLPSESEWEYAARGGESHLYAGSDHLDDVACWERKGIGTCTSGTKHANGYGLVDMSGNVWEWVEDCYSSSYDDLSADGSVHTVASCEERVRRGGCWWGSAEKPGYFRVANRYKAEPAKRSHANGFRIVR